MPRDPFSNVQDRAAWAEEFKNATTNAAQRTRYREDMAAGRRDEEMADAADFEAAQLADPELGRLMLGRARENRARFEGEANRDFRERQLQFQQGRAERQQELAQKKFGLDLLKQEIAEEKALREIEDAAKIKLQTKAFQDSYYDLIKHNIRPGSPGFAEGIGAAIINNPFADPDAIRAAAADARIDIDPADLQFEANRLGVTNPKFSMRQDAHGRSVYSFSEGAQPKETDPDKEYESVLKEWKDAVSLRARMTETKNGKEVPAPGFSDNDRLLADKLKTRFEKRLSELEGGMKQPAQEQSAETPPTTAPPTVPQIIINRKTGERMTLKDGAWQPLK